MSDFTVLRSLDGYCLVLDNKRIAGGKPDYRGENVLVDWTTEVAYGPVDDLAAENAKLREQGERLFDKTLELGTENAKLRELLIGAFEDMDAWQKVIAGSNEWGYGKGCLDRLCKLRDAMQELGMEVEVR